MMIFQFLILLIFAPIGIGLLIIGIKNRYNWIGKILLGLFAIGILLIIGLIVLHWATSKTELEREDVYGEYIIDRTKFSGHQADWQYNHFRFVIKPNDSIYFYETEEDKIIRVNQGTVSFLDNYKRPRIILNIDTPRHHIIESKPTLYRTPWDFYYVFKSPKFRNVFFTKRKWEPIEKK